ncbi:MAG TPA: hypothetical protein VK509_18540 [Polyangiales bacterium]|nr:hypothetical protein [Polyangiales bacterium]
MLGASALHAAAVGCGGGAARVPDPSQPVTQLARAIERDRPDDAYALLDPRLRAQLSRQRFTALWKDNRGELRELAHKLARRELATDARARVELEDGEQVAVVLQDGGWRVEGGVLDAQALSAPLDTVAELRRALQRQSLPALLRVLSRERRAAWMATFERSAQQTADPLDLRVEVHGDEAIVHLTGGGEIHLKKEAGRWQIWDVR